ncbi:ankyrin repeat domain-containing protein [Lentisphaerota bacterium WC36G]|nr:ankyrin repeat domain-containing protein [Lentisphaerae bacterium WC36]
MKKKNVILISLGATLWLALSITIVVIQVKEFKKNFKREFKKRIAEIGQQHSQNQIKFEQNIQEQPKIVFPKQKNIVTQEDFLNRASLPFFRKWLGKTPEYKQHPLFDLYCKHLSITLSTEEYDYAVKKSQELLKKNPDDIISFLVAWSTGGVEKTDEEWANEFKRLEEKAKNYIDKFFIARGYYYATNKNFNQGLIFKTNYILFDLAKNEKLSKYDQQTLFRYLGNYDNYHRAYLNKTLAINSQNSWLKNTLLGELYIDIAWDKRGSGWASTVSEKGWDGFKKYISIAREHLEKAYQEYPDLPEAPNRLISVAMADSEDSEIIWFNRSIAAQIDYKKSYSKLSWALRPRWCGSIQKLKEFANACVESNIDNRVPYRSALKIYKNIAEELSNDKWQKIYREKDVANNIEKILTKLHKIDTEKKAPADKWYTFRKIWILFYQGKYTEAQKLMNSCDIKDFKEENETMYSSSIFVEWINVYDELTGMGNLTAEMEKVDSLYMKDKELAIDELHQLLEKKNLTKTQQLYLCKKICEMKSIYGVDDSRFECHLLIAIESNDYQLAQKMLDLGYNINYKNSIGRTALFYSATRNKNLTAVKFLVNKGADLETKDKWGYTALFFAARYKNNGKIIKYLIKSGADIETRSNLHYTPLMFAIERKKINNVKTLVEAGAKINIQCRTHTMWKCVRHTKNQQIIDYMLSHGLEKKLSLN